MNEVAAHLRSRLAGWLNRRIPSAAEITLNQHSIFIFPTKSGFAFLGLLLLLLFGAINYQNSLIFTVTFLLGSLFVVTILHTYKNLSQLTIKSVRSKNGYCGGRIEFFVHISCPKDNLRENIQIGWPAYDLRRFDLNKDQQTELSIWSIAKTRGHYRPGRVRVSTTFPLGLLRAWTWVDLNFQSIVYPKPIEHPLPFALGSNTDSDSYYAPHSSGDDFYALRSYQFGDPVKHISWRHYARTEQLHLQQHAKASNQSIILDWHQVDGDIETRLSILTGWAQQLMQRGVTFGLKLPNCEIPPNQGSSHHLRVLTSLALFPQDIS